MASEVAKGTPVPSSAASAKSDGWAALLHKDWWDTSKDGQEALQLAGLLQKVCGADASADRGANALATEFAGLAPL